MGFLDGDLAELVGSNLVDAGLSVDVVLIKVTPSARNPAAPTAATTSTLTSHPCQGFAAATEAYNRAGTLISGVRRIVKIYGSTLPAGVRPAPGDRITIAGVTSVVANDDGDKRAVQTDAAGAVHTCQCL